jgi:predicted cupin superfamily sugar epimerase
MTELPDWARQLDLQPHRGRLVPRNVAERPDHPRRRAAAGHSGPRTAILFLLMPGQQSAWHTVRSAELWFFHRGGPLELEVGAEHDTATTQLLGSDITAGQQPQFIVPPGHWQRARPVADEPCLVSCVVVPGFDFADFTMHG